MTRIPVRVLLSSLPSPKSYSNHSISSFTSQPSFKLKLPMGTSSVWLRNVGLDSVALNRLKSRRIIGQEKTRQIAFNKRRLRNQEIQANAHLTFSNINPEPFHYVLIASLLFWTEGSKDPDSGLRFTNSDPKMVKLFLKALKSLPDFSWKKLKFKLHLHDYHNQFEQTQFWAKEAEIPHRFFLKPYLKPHTSIRKRENYPGCISLYYNDVKTNRYLTALYKEIIEKFS